MMQYNGIAQIFNQGVLYKADGSSTHVAKIPLSDSCGPAALSKTRTIQDGGGCNPNIPDGTETLQQIYQVTVNGSWFNTALLSPGFMGLEPAVGPAYSFSAAAFNTCTKSAVDTAMAVWSVITVIQKNASSYSPAMNSAAAWVGTRWAGVAVTNPEFIAAMIDFAAILFAEIPPLLLIELFMVAGYAAWAAAETIWCLGHGY